MGSQGATSYQIASRPSCLIPFVLVSSPAIATVVFVIDEVVTTTTELHDTNLQ